MTCPGPPPHSWRNGWGTLSFRNAKSATLARVCPGLYNFSELACWVTPYEKILFSDASFVISLNTSPPPPSCMIAKSTELLAPRTAAATLARQTVASECGEKHTLKGGRLAVEN